MWHHWGNRFEKTGFWRGERSCLGAVGNSEIKKLSTGYILSIGYFLTKDFFGEILVVVSRLQTSLTTTRKTCHWPSEAPRLGLKSCPLANFYSTEGFF